MMEEARMTKPRMFGVVVVLSAAVVAVAATTVGTQPEEPGGDEGARRVELEQFLGALQERLAGVAAPRECAPRVSFGEHVRMFATDIERSPLSADQAQRIMKGLIELEDLTRYYEGAVDEVCGLAAEYRVDEVERERVRADVQGRLTSAVTAVQSRLPATPAALESVFPNYQCYTSKRHVSHTTICLREGTPFEAMEAFIQVDADGAIGPRHDPTTLGQDTVLGVYHGGRTWGIATRNHTRISAEGKVQVSDGQRFTVGIQGKMKKIRTESTMLTWAKSDLKYYYNRSRLDLPRSATITGIYVGRLVDAVRRHATATCATTVGNGARLAQAFNEYAPSDGEAAQVYADAAKVVRADIEGIAPTGSADICSGTNTALQALVGPATREAMPEPKVDGTLVADARMTEELTLRDYSRELRKNYLLGDLDAQPVANQASR